MYPSMMYVLVWNGVVPTLTTNIPKVGLGYTLISNCQPITYVLTQ
jgi:hypothetical protein